ncbi:hypothetical protein EJB05_20795, partial [Eragrostis curvula]
MTLLNLHFLNLLDLDSNNLANEVPSNIGNALPNLIFLALGGNKFEGQIPASLGNALGLETIDLSRNNFTGPIPASFGNISGLTLLSLDYNMLEAWDNQGWEFLTALGNCNQLQVLSLAYNRLRGVLPSSVGNLSSNLQYLILTRNSISGIVPPSIGKLSGLIDLVLAGNNFTGKLEGWIGGMKNLEVLHLEENNFVGLIPGDLGNLTHMFSLILAKNKFEGPIPRVLGKNQQNEELDLSYNMLQGYIPKEVLSLSKLRTCDLSHNNLEGPIPLSKFEKLTELYLSSNRLTGQVPDSMGQCQSLQIIQMDHNFLAGKIPVSIGNIVSLINLNLSHNNFSGTIPLTLSDLRYLTILDISYNRLYGEIPRNGVFANAAAISLDGNWGLCGGPMDMHMPLCPGTPKRVEKHYYLMEVLVTLFGVMSLIMLIYIIIVHAKKTSGRPYLLLFSFVQATGNFSESKLVGRGSYGSVYKGKLTQAKIQVAVKVFDLEMKCADQSFVSECEVFRNIRHRNLLPILTACSTIDNGGNDFKALIYEFMHNGNLDTWLHHRLACVPLTHLSLVQRISIAVDVADALAYLHHDCGRPIVHCDVKPTNILLDDDIIWETSALQYAQSVHASTCGDVYSYGIVLLEMLLGKRPTDSMFDGELSIVSFVERNFRDHILQIIDANLQEECRGFMKATLGKQNEVHRCLVSLVQVALSCSRLFPRERMNMREVAANLHSIRRSYVSAIKGDQAMLR